MTTTSPLWLTEIAMHRRELDEIAEEVAAEEATEYDPEDVGDEALDDLARLHALDEELPIRTPGRDHR